MATATLNIVSMDIRNYATGEKIGTAKVSASFADAYAECKHGRFQWPEGIAKLSDAFGDEDGYDVDCNADGETVIWLE